MGLVNIPVIAYIDGGTRQITNQIIADDNAYQAMYAIWETAGKPSSSFALFHRWHNVNYTTEQAHKEINDLLNSYIFSNKLKFYVANTLTPGTDLSDLQHDLSVGGIVPTFFAQSTNTVTRLVTLDNVDLIDSNTTMGTLDYDSITHNAHMAAVNYQDGNIEAWTVDGQVFYTLTIYPSDIFTGNAVTGGNYSDETDPVFVIRIRFNINGDYITDIAMWFHGRQLGISFSRLVDFYDGVNIHTPGTTEDDLDNPYGYEGTSTTGGGGGKYGDIDGIEPTDVPDLPSVNAASLGLITLYNPSAAQVNNLASYLWSGMFDPDSFKKLFSDPMGCLLGLSIVPAIPGTGGTKNIMFGNVDSGISCSYLSTNYVNVDCGSVSIV